MQIRHSMRYLLWAQLLLLSACGPVVKTVDRPSQAPEATASQLLQQIKDNGRIARSLKGLARVEVESPERDFGASQVLIAQKPDLLRTETLSMFGQPILLLAADGEHLRVLIPGQNRFYQGEASGNNLRRFVKVPLRLTDLVHLLLYQVPLTRSIEKRVTATEQGPRLELFGTDGQYQVVDFDSSLRVVRCTLARKGETWLEISYRHFQEGDQFPRGMEMKLPGYGARLDIEFNQLELNPQLDPQRFVLVRPAGSSLIELPGD